MKDSEIRVSLREGVLKGGLPYFSFGSGPVLVVFPGIGPSNALATGIGREVEIRSLMPLARHFTVYAVNRRIGLPSDTSIASLVADYAHAIEEEFAEPVYILGLSTGGHHAQQLAIDYPHLVRRLVLCATAYRMSPVGWKASRDSADLAAVGQTRKAMSAMKTILTDSRVAQIVAGGLLWLVAPFALGKNWNPSDMIATLRADLSFDVGDRLKEITTPSLLIGGLHDPCYPPDLVKETARRIPNARVIFYNRSHGGVMLDRKFGPDVFTFLLEKSD